MSKLTQKHRDARDQISARMAIDMAQHQGKVAGIAVDDAARAQRMLSRVRDIATKLELTFEVEENDGWIEVQFGLGIVRIIEADRIFITDGHCRDN